MRSFTALPSRLCFDTPAGMRHFRRYRRSAQFRRLIAGVALAAYLAATVGVPLPKSLGKHSGVPFPCQDHACGCQDAEACWDHCCCYSPAEKLAWAHRHGVEPPATLVAQVAASGLAVASEHAAPRRACCARHEHAAHASSHDEHDAAGCEQCAGDDEPTIGIVLAMGPLARGCQGMVELWSASGAVVPPPPAVAWNFQWNVVEWLAPAAFPFDSRELAPPVPPPRV